MLKPKNKESKEKHEILLTNGSFLLMTGDTQKYWQHQIPRSTKTVKPRINLTFRIVQ
jgi:alkylated DNA repair dioxygenase AlkB